MLKKEIRFAWNILKAAIRHLSDHDLFRMAGATAFFTTFALPAILMIIVRTLGLFIDRRTVGRQMGKQLREILGSESMDSILQAIRSFSALQHGYLFTAGVFVFLLFVATTLFKVIRNSINEIWGVRSTPHGKLLVMLKSRIVSVAVILLGGILFLAVQFIDAGQHMFSAYLIDNLPDTTFYLGRGLKVLLAILISTAWFYVLFSFLPDGRPSRKIALSGAVITAILFSIGKWILGILLSPGNVNSFYGASGAMVLVLLFMFYSSIILYFGAALIRSASEAYGSPVIPKSAGSMVIKPEMPDHLS
jgi:membrane protein